MQQLPRKILAPHAAQNVFVARKLFLTRFERRQHRQNDWNVFRSRPLAAFLFAADNQWRDVAFGRDLQEANAARSTKLVCRAAEIITFAQTFGGHFTEPLHGIGKERHLVLAADGQRLAPRLNHAGFVVGGHHGDKSRPHVRQFDREPVQVDHPGVGDGNEFDALAEILLRRFHDAGMFNGGNPHLGLRVQHLRQVVHRHVVGLGRAARPDDFVRQTAEEARELFARVNHGLAGRRAELVRAGRIAGDVLGGIQPGLARLADDRRGGIMVEINHRADKIQLNAALASFLWAAVNASCWICAGVFHKPPVFVGESFSRVTNASKVMR